MTLFEQLLAMHPNERESFVDRLLALPEAPPDVPLPRGSVPYLPASVAEILEVAKVVRSDDVFVDLGSGLGRVVMLVHMLTGARARGIEIQEPLVRIARERASALKLDVTFEHANVLDADLDGTVFFLYAPFNGDTLERVMGRLEHARVVWRKETID